MASLSHHDTAITPRRQRSAWEIQRAVLFALLLRELKTRFGGRWLGVYWALLEPLAQLAIFTLLLGGFHRAVLPGIDYPVFLLTGIVPFFLFRNLALRLMDGIDANRALFAYGQVKPIDTLLARAMLEVTLYLLISILMFGAFSAFNLAWWPYRPLEIFALGALVAAGGFGLGLCLAVGTHRFEQARSVVRVVFMPLYMLSGVITPLRVAPTDWWPLLLLNPLVHVTDLSRAYFLPNYRVADGTSLTYVAMSALVPLAGGLAMYHVRRHELLSD